MMGASNDFPIFWSIKAAVTELDPYWDNLHLLYTQLLVWGPNFLNPESPIDTPFWLSHQRISTTKLRDNFFLPHTNILQSRLFNHGFLSLYKIHSAISNNITAAEYSSKAHTHKKGFLCFHNCHIEIHGRRNCGWHRYPYQGFKYCHFRNGVGTKNYGQF